MNGALLQPAPLPLNSTAADLSRALAAALGVGLADAGVEVAGAPAANGSLRWRLAASRAKVSLAVCHPVDLQHACISLALRLIERFAQLPPCTIRVETRDVLMSGHPFPFALLMLACTRCPP